MFTGLIAAMRPVTSIRRIPDGARLLIDLGDALEPLPAISDSVCVQGACLTVIEIKGTVVAFDVVRETLDRTTLGSLRVGSRVNVESSLCLGDQIGGHLVTGHVDGVATVTDVVRRKDSMEVTIRPPADYFRFIAEKGSVALGGVSLTVAGLRGDAFWVAIVPYTAQVTTFCDVKVGTRLNLEVDILARYVARWIGSTPSPGPEGRT